MENENVNSPESSLAPEKPARSKLERTIVWTIIGLLVVFALVEVMARFGYVKTLKDFESAIETTERPLTLADFNNKLKSGVVIEGAGEIEGKPTILYRWPSMLQKYELHLTLSPHDNETLRTYATNDGMSSFITMPQPPGEEVPFTDTDLQPAPGMPQADGGGASQGRGARGGGRRNPLRLLMSEPIVAELKLNEEQKTQVQDLIESLPASSPDPSQTAEERAHLQETQNQEFLQKLKELLDETQFTRTRQILLHVRGIEALTQNDVAEELKLSLEQREQIASIVATHSEKRQALFQQMRDGEIEGSAFGEKRVALDEETKTQALAVLSEEQKQAWETLLGPAPPQPERSSRPRRSE